MLTPAAPAAVTTSATVEAAWVDRTEMPRSIRSTRNTPASHRHPAARASMSPLPVISMRSP